MLILGIAINGLYSVISMNSNFFTFEVMAKGLMAAILYLGFIWINSRKHQLLTYIGVIGICLVVIFVSFSSKGVAGSFSGWNWNDTVMCVYYAIAFQFASYQGKKLLEEDKENISINFYVAGDIKSEEIEGTDD